MPTMSISRRGDGRSCCLLTNAPSYEPHGFEGFGALLVELPLKDAPVAKGHDRGVPRFDLDSVPTPKSMFELESPRAHRTR